MYKIIPNLYSLLKMPHNSGLLYYMTCSSTLKSLLHPVSSIASVKMDIKVVVWEKVLMYTYYWGEPNSVSNVAKSVGTDSAYFIVSRFLTAYCTGS